MGALKNYEDFNENEEISETTRLMDDGYGFIKTKVMIKHEILKEDK